MSLHNIDAYSGHGQIRRLIHAAQVDSAGAPGSLRRAVDIVKGRRQSIRQYQQLATYINNSDGPDTEVDEDWVQSVQAELQSRAAELETALNVAMTSQDKDAMRVS